MSDEVPSIIKMQNTRAGLIILIKKKEAELPSLTRAKRKQAKAVIAEAYGLLERLTAIIRKAQGNE